MNAWSAIPMFDRLFDDVMNGVTALGSAAPAAARSFTPAVDIRATGEELVLSLDVPGVKRDDLEITLEDGVLTIKGHRKYEGDAKEKVWLGRSYGSFERSFTLPETADAENLSADLADGVLTIRVGQVAKAKPRKITIAPRHEAPKLPADGAK